MTDFNDPTKPGSIADLIPRKFRRTIYSALTAVFALELIWDVIPDVWEGKLVMSLGALGMGMAAVYAKPR